MENSIKWNRRGWYGEKIGGVMGTTAIGIRGGLVEAAADGSAAVGQTVFQMTTDPVMAAVASQSAETAGIFSALTVAYMAGNSAGSAVGVNARKLYRQIQDEHATDDDSA